MMCLQTQHDQCHAELSKTAKYATELENRLLTTTADLQSFQELARNLQETINVTQNDLEIAVRSLEMEKQNNKELQATIDGLSGNLERSGKKLEGIDVQFALLKKELIEKRLELQNMVQENHAIKLELRQSQDTSTHLQCKLDQCTRELNAQDVELVDTKDTMGSMAQKLAVTYSDIEKHRCQLQHFHSQLSSSEAENAKLVKECKMYERELQRLKTELAMAGKEVMEKKTKLASKEDELRVLMQERITFTTEITDYKRQVQSLSTVKYSLENDLDMKASDVDREHRRTLQVSIVKPIITVAVISINFIRSNMRCTKGMNY